MNKVASDIVVRLQQAEPQLRAAGIAHAAVFGSVARGEEGPGSDIDVLVDLIDRNNASLIDVARAMQAVEAIVPGRVHVAIETLLKPAIRETAKRDLIVAF